MLNHKPIAIILGTRPEIIKMSPIIRACQKRGLPFFIIHTNQHYSANLDRIFFQELNLPRPKYNLHAGSGSHGAVTGKMLEKSEKVLQKERPKIVLVEGDTNTVLAGALAAVKLRIKVGHVEAGLRSYDPTMPEEHNRRLTDHISDFLFVPTQGAVKNLKKEGISGESVIITGNTIVDAVRQTLAIAKKRSRILHELGLRPKQYILATAHRQENADDKKRLPLLFKGLGLVVRKSALPIILPIHPRTKKMIARFRLRVPAGVKLIEPTGFLDFLTLEDKAKLILTDSGGVQEEACILRVPCVTLRDNTERPETVAAGANKLAGVNPQQILKQSLLMANKLGTWKNPFGDGHAGEKTIAELYKNL